MPAKYTLVGNEIRRNGETVAVVAPEAERETSLRAELVRDLKLLNEAKRDALYGNDQSE